MRPLLPLLLVPALLAACETPQQRCESRAVKDLRVVNGLIEESLATIQRGYALETVQNTRPVATFCWGGGYGGDWDAGYGLCWANTTYTTREPVAVNLDEERATLRTLESKREELEVRARAELAACQVPAAG
jgi:hypothetical protein